MSKQKFNSEMETIARRAGMSVEELMYESTYSEAEREQHIQEYDSLAQAIILLAKSGVELHFDKAINMWDIIVHCPISDINPFPAHHAIKRAENNSTVEIGLIGFSKE